MIDSSRFPSALKNAYEKGVVDAIKKSLVINKVYVNIDNILSVQLSFHSCFINKYSGLHYYVHYQEQTELFFSIHGLHI